MTINLRQTLIHLTRCFILSIIVFAFILLCQPGSISVVSIFDHLFKNHTESISVILWDIRLPRAVAAYVVGGSLAVAGLTLQLVVRNPLAEPFILGISSGANTGIILSFLLGTSAVFIQSAGAFTGALLVTVMVYFIGLRFGKLDNGRLLLGGVMMGSFLSAVMFISIPFMGDSIRMALSWFMGNLGLGTKTQIYSFAPIMVLLIGVLYLFSYKFNLMTTGEEVASQLGVQVDTVKKLSYLCVSILTGLSVCISGIIGFVGLMIPHAARFLYGSDHRILIPFSFISGGILLMLSDWMARSLFYPVELPVGAITAFLGAPFFVWLLRSK